MALTLQLQAGASDLYAYIQDYKEYFPYDGHGEFNGMGEAGDQWVAGNYTLSGQPANGLYSAIMAMDDYNYTEGDFEGTVTELALGHSLVYNYTSDIYTQTPDLVITQAGGYLPVTTAFTYGIYSLSHGGELDGGVYFGRQFLGLTDYFAEQGTIQIGATDSNSNPVDDVLLSFAGDDTLTGNGSVNLDIFQWHYDYYELVGVVSDANGTVLGWGDDIITDFTDGTDSILIEGFGWNDYTEFSAAGGCILDNVVTYADSVNGITSTITVNFDGTGTLGWDDFVFIA